jgi:hypothetical protein
MQRSRFRFARSAAFEIRSSPKGVCACAAVSAAPWFLAIGCFVLLIAVFVSVLVASQRTSISAITGKDMQALLLLSTGLARCLLSAAFLSRLAAAGGSSGR